MHHDTLFLGLSQIALFLGAVFFCFYTTLARARRATFITRPNFPDCNPWIAPATFFFFSNQQSSPQFSPSPGAPAVKHTAKSRFSATGDWLVPIIVRGLVILMGLAIVGFLLGDR